MKNTPYLRRGVRDKTSFVWSTAKRDALARADQSSLSSNAGLRTERPRVKIEKTAHDLMQEIRSKGLHLLGDL